MLAPIDNLEGKKLFFASDFHLGVPDHASSLERERRITRWLDSIRDEQKLSDENGQKLDEAIEIFNENFEPGQTSLVEVSPEDDEEEEG